MAIARALVLLAWLGALVATAGAAAIVVPLFAAGGLVAALALLAWGFVVYDEPTSSPPLGDNNNRVGGFRPASPTSDAFETSGRGGTRRPVWDTDVMGAPE